MVLQSLCDESEGPLFHSTITTELDYHTRKQRIPQALTYGPFSAPYGRKMKHPKYKISKNLPVEAPQFLLWTNALELGSYQYSERCKDATFLRHTYVWQSGSSS